MKRKALAAIAALEGLILLVLLANALGWLDFLPRFELFGCDGEIYATAQSPDKTQTAYAFERDCGATTGLNTFVIVRVGAEKLDLTKDLVKDEIVFTADGDYRPQLSWTAKGALAVTFAPTQKPPSEEIWTQIIRHQGTTIEYNGVR